MNRLGLVGWSGSGKTTLMVRLLPELVGRGIAVSTMKHAHHNFDIDRPGKDSYEHRQAGATEVLVSSSRRWALIHENRDEDEADLEHLIERMTPVDLLLVEGYKGESLDKIEIHRPSNGKALLAPSDPLIVAVASDEELPGLRVPRLDLNDVAAIADFIVAHCDLVGAKGPA